MTVFNAILSGWFDGLFGLFRSESPWPSMIVVSFVTTVMILLVFKLTSNQASLKRRRSQAIARLLEFVLFRDDVVVSLGAFWRVIGANVMYLGYVLVPLSISMAPGFIILVQSSCWFSARPLKPGEATVLTVQLRDDLPVMEQSLVLETSPGFVSETDPVRVPSRNEVSWRLRATAAGDGWADLHVNGTGVRKSMVSGGKVSRLAPVRPQAGFWSQLVHPGEPPLPAGGPVAAMKIAYPAAGLELAGRSRHWLLVFFVLSLVFGLILMKPMKVTV